MKEKTKLKKIADKLHIKTNALRYYEKVGLIKFDRLANGYRILNEEQRIRLNIVVMCRSARMAIVDIREILPEDVILINLLKIQLIIAKAKMRAYERIFINAEDLFEKYEKFNEDSRLRILEDIPLNIGETWNAKKIIADVNKSFEEQEEKFEINTVNGKVSWDENLLLANLADELLKNGLINIMTYNKIKDEVEF